MSKAGDDHEAALRLYAEGNVTEGLAALGRAARAGWRPALTELGARLVVGAGAPRSPMDGEGLLAAAAKAGDPLALRYRAGVWASGVLGREDWPLARELLKSAAQAGDGQAREDLEWLAEIDRRGTPKIEWLSDAPRVARVRGMMPVALCRWLIAEAPPEMAAAEVTDGSTGASVLEAARTNRFAQVRLFDMPVSLIRLRAIMAMLTGSAVTTFETMNLLRYEPGQEFRRHHDYLDPAKPGFAVELATEGQRIATFLVYLNEDFEGGETEFLTTGQRVRGAAGDGLFFFNVTQAGTIDPRSEHAGLAPVRGDKWLLSQWIRDRTQVIH